MARIGKIVVICALALVAAFAARVEMRFAWADFFPPDSTATAATARVRALFGDEARPFIFVAVGKGAATWEPSTLEMMASFARELRSRSWVQAIHSPFTTPGLVAEGDTLVSRIPLWPLPASADEARQIDARLRTQAMPGQPWVSRDGSALLIVVELTAAYAEELSRSPEAIAELDVEANRLRESGIRVELAGVPVVEARSADFLRRESVLFLGLAVALMAVVIGFTFGRLVLVLAVLGVGAGTVAFFFGLLGLLDLPLTMLTSATPVVLLVVVACDLIHVVSDHLRLRAAGQQPEDARTEAFARGLRSCFWTSVTSAAGFATFGYSSIPAIRGFAIATALGIMGGYVVAMLALPSILRRLEPRPVPLESIRRAVHLRWYGWSHRLLVQHARWLLIGSAVVAAGMLVVGSRVRIDATIYDELDPDHPIVRANRYLGEQFLGENSVSMALRLPPGSSFVDDDHFARLAWLQQRLQDESDVMDSVGLYALLDWARRLYGDDAAELQRWPAGLPAKILPLFDLAGDEGVRYLARFFVTQDGAEWTRLDLRFGNPSSRGTLAMLAVVKNELAERWPEVEVTYAGQTHAAMLAYTGLTLQAFWGMIYAMVVIFALMVASLRSLPRALFAMVPNLFPLLACLALFAVTGTTLKPSSILIFSVALGLAVDDTLHLLRRMEELLPGRSRGAAVLLAWRRSASALWRSTMVVGLGFAVLSFSDSRAISMLGVTILMAAGVALLADLYVLPAIYLVASGPSGKAEPKGRTAPSI